VDLVDSVSKRCALVRVRAFAALDATLACNPTRSIQRTLLDVGVDHARMTRANLVWKVIYE
jgi:hypothetical protein